jgi:hypothetical protein
MNANGFREDELVTRKVKVNGQWETRTFPIIGGRLRLAHEQNDNLGLQTELVSWDGQYAVFKCSAVTAKGQFIGYGTANAQRDARLAESLVELAETRSIARALRFAGYGLEFCGAEEVSHVMETEAGPERTTGKEPQQVFPGGNGNGKSEVKAGGNGNGKATQAQVRALFALSKKAQYGEEDIHHLIAPLNASAFQGLSREEASRLITYLQTEAAA